MARIGGEIIIQQKITELNQQITHFEECIKQAKEHQAILRQALIALQANPFSTLVKRKQEHIFPIEVALFMSPK